MKPNCYNRPPFAAGRWHYTGEWRRNKPVMRWYPRWFVDRCATHDGVGIGPNNENYPAAHGWDCSGCRLDPARDDLQGIIPDIGVVFRFHVPADILRNAGFGETYRDIDAFEPIQRSIQR